MRCRPCWKAIIFSSLFEGATAWKVGACQRRRQDRALPRGADLCAADAGPQGEKPANWNDTVLLVNTPQGWKVDDVVYDAGLPSAIPASSATC